MELRNAIATACEAILLSDARKDDGSGAYDRAVKAALKGLIWLYSEQTSIPGDAYFSCPFWSAGALAEFRKHGREIPRNLLHFEHVFPREIAEREL